MNIFKSKLFKPALCAAAVLIITCSILHTAHANNVNRYVNRPIAPIIYIVLGVTTQSIGGGTISTSQEVYAFLNRERRDTSRQHLYPSYFGGIYYQGSRLTVLIVESRSNEAQGLLALLDQGVHVREVEYSHQELLDLMELLNANADQAAAFSSAWGMDTISNRVFVEMTRYTEEEIARFRTEVMDSPMIVFRDPRAVEGDNISEPLRINPELEPYVTMAVTEVSPSSVTVTIRNDSDLPLTTGYLYRLEVYDNGVWRFIPSSRAVILIAIPIFPQDSLEMTKDLDEYAHLMEPGLFRIRKDVFIDTWQTGELVNGFPSALPIDTTHELTAEFDWR